MSLHVAVLARFQTCIYVSCFSKIQIGFTFLVSANLGSLRQNPEARNMVVVVVVVVVVFIYVFVCVCLG